MKLTLTVADVVKVDVKDSVKDFVKELRVELSERQENILELKDFSLSLAEFDHMDMLDFDVLKKEFSLMNDEKRNKAKEYFLNLAMIDGNFHTKEKAIINGLIME